MARFSANLGFLWADLPLPDAIRAAGAAGFDAVECHWPYDTPTEAVNLALRDSGLTMLGLNTMRGGPGENGLTALPGREAEARAEIDRAIGYARRIGCSAVHVMAGFAQGDGAARVFEANLDYACRRAAPHGITILIEPINQGDAPGYFLRTTNQAAGVIRALGHDNLRLMFDCYHVQITEGDVARRLHELMPILGHIQIAAVPDRGPPDHGELDYRHICALLDGLGWQRPLGAEYRANGDTAQSLNWMGLLRDRPSPWQVPDADAATTGTGQRVGKDLG